jgi:hypothetical protein
MRRTPDGFNIFQLFLGVIIYLFKVIQRYCKMVAPFHANWATPDENYLEVIQYPLAKILVGSIPSTNVPEGIHNPLKTLSKDIGNLCK